MIININPEVLKLCNDLAFRVRLTGKDHHKINYTHAMATSCLHIDKKKENATQFL